MIVDYLTFTFPKEHEVNLPYLVKAVDPGAVALETKSGYAEYWTLWGSGWLKWGHRGEVPAHLSLPGSALALYRESGGDIGTLIITVGEAGARCTRVDVAFDWEVEATPMIDRIEESVQQDNCTSRWKLDNSRSCYRIKSSRAAGDTYYLGSPQSDCRIRFYDKAAEQGEEMPWFRAELQIRKERADAALCFLTVADEEAVEYFKMLILGYIDIKEPKEGTLFKYDWPTADWWADMWGTQKGRIVLGSEMPTEDDSRAYVEKLAPTMAILVELDGGDPSWLLDAIKEGGRPIERGGRRRAVHVAKLRAWRKARKKG